MKLDEFDEKIHSHVLFWISLLSILFVFFNSNLWISLVVCISILLLFSYQGLKFLRHLKKILFIILISFFSTYFILLNPAKEYLNSSSFNLLGIQFSTTLFKIQTVFFSRVVFVSLISIFGVYSINFEKILIEMMKKKVFSPKFGYAILLAFNSVSSLREEFGRIQINAKFRGLSIWQRYNVFIPLLVYAIRHADRGAMSLLTRGTHEEKLFYFDTELRSKDYLIFIFYLFFILVCGLIQFFL